MPVRSVPSHRYSDGHRKLFGNLVWELRTDLEEKCVPNSPGYPRNKQFLPSGDALKYLKDSRRAKKTVERLGELTVPDIPESPLSNASCDTLTSQEISAELFSPSLKVPGVPESASQEAGAEKFWQEVVGKDVQPQDARAILLAILVTCDVTLNCNAWQNFFYHTQSAAASGEERLCDSLLPFEHEEDVERWFGYDPSINVLILNRQFIFCAPVNESSVGPGLRMPYLEERLIHCRSSTDQTPCKRVSEVRLHPNHYPSLSDSGLLARKSVDSRTSEVPIVRQIKNNPHSVRNIVTIRFIVSFPAENKVDIFMDLADSDMCDWMKEVGRPVVFETITQHFKNFLGLGTGLELLHDGIRDPETMARMTIVHGDFRFQNILVRRNGGNVLFQITDFGLSYMGYGTSDTVEFENPQQGGDCPGMPPEALELMKSCDRPKITCAYDVYLFCATTCMFLAWLLGGMKGYDNFEEQRMNKPFDESNVKRNPWFFSVHRVRKVFPDGRFARAAKSMINPRNLYATLQPPKGDVDVELRLNDRVDRFFEGIMADKNVGRRKKKFVLDMYAVARDGLAPNPAKRPKMKQLLEKLHAAVSQNEIGGS